MKEEKTKSEELEKEKLDELETKEEVEKEENLDELESKGELEKEDSNNKVKKENKRELKEKKLENLKNKKGYKAFKIISNIIYVVLVIFILMLLAVVLVQRFSNNEISLGGIKIYNIVSESMVPKYQIGDILVAKDVDVSTLKVGDDIVYKGEKQDFAGKIVTHQIIKIEENNGEYTITTKGIANELEDPTITGKQVQGKIVYKFIILSAVSKIVNNLFSMYFIIFIPVAIIIFLNIIKIVKGFKEVDDEEEEEENNKK